MGTVYLCEHRYMRRRVAIKLLPPDKSAHGTSLERFRREARAAAKLDHPNIVQAHDIDNDGPIHFIVMEYIDGISLQQLVDSHGPLSIARSVNYMIQIADGLQHAQIHNLVHRDIKPSNLLLERTGIIKILDLGLARFEDSEDGLTKRFDSKTVLGTADYLAPEQALCSQVDIRADIYSLGCVGYFMLAGRPIFDGGNVAQKLVKHQTTMPMPIHQLRPAVPVELSHVLERMLKKKKEDRYATPGEVIQALRPWFESVDPPTAEEMPLHRFSHHRDIATLSKISTMATLQSGITRAMDQSSITTATVK
jgi:serine/threonine protein kinase